MFEGDGKIAQHLRALAPLKDVSVGPSTLAGQLIATCNSRSGGSKLFSDLYRTLFITNLGL